MSSPTLRVNLDNIVNKPNFSTDGFDDAGVKSTVKRGQTLDTLAQCKGVYLLLIANKDAVKRWYTYRAVIIKDPHRLAIKYF